MARAHASHLPAASSKGRSEKGGKRKVLTLRAASGSRRRASAARAQLQQQMLLLHDPSLGSATRDRRRFSRAAARDAARSGHVRRAAHESTELVGSRGRTLTELLQARERRRHERGRRPASAARRSSLVRSPTICGKARRVGGVQSVREMQRGGAAAGSWHAVTAQFGSTRPARAHLGWARTTRRCHLHRTRS